MKLGTLAVKTISKPLASQLKHQAKVHPKFRQSIINFAQVSDSKLAFEIRCFSWSRFLNFLNLVGFVAEKGVV